MPILAQMLLLVWLYIAVHGFAAPSSHGAPPGPLSWRKAAGKLAAEGTPAAVLAGSDNLANPNILAGASLDTYSLALLLTASFCRDLFLARLDRHLGYMRVVFVQNWQFT